MIPIIPTPGQIESARREAARIGSLRNSIRGGAGNVVGVLAEIVVADLHGLRREPTYDYDLIGRGGATVDVKAKEVHSVPRPHYRCSVADYNPNQSCDYYYFARVLADLSRVWLLGYMPRAEFYERAEYMRAGEVDANDRNGRRWRVRADCWNVDISELYPIGELVMVRREPNAVEVSA